MTSESLLLDACVAINLVAAEDLGVIGHALDLTFLMADEAANEMGFLRDEADGKVKHTPIDLSRAAKSGAVRLLSLGDGELGHYVELAGVVDDGEAATIAIAKARGIPMATDDKKARRICAELSLPEPKRSLDILRSYAEAALLNEQNTREALFRVRTRASFRPQRIDPNYTWWLSYVGEA